MDIYEGFNEIISSSNQLVFMNTVIIFDITFIKMYTILSSSSCVFVMRMKFYELGTECPIQKLHHFSEMSKIRCGTQYLNNMVEQK